jgi:hypothetical protein
MRHEPGRVAPVEMTAAVNALAADWLARGEVEHLRQVGSGRCYEFVEELFDALGIDICEGGGRGVVQSCTEDWWVDDFEADLGRLRDAGEPVPDDLPEDELAALIGGATHTWATLGGRHYDAEVPEGVDHFLCLPFFARQLEALRQTMRARSGGRGPR